MIRMTIAAVAALFVYHLAFPAHGAYIATCSFTLRGYVCAEGEEYQQPSAKIINVPPSEEEDARMRAWLAFCQPRVVTDALGVERLVYAHDGCANGRVK